MALAEYNQASNIRAKSPEDLKVTQVLKRGIAGSGTYEERVESTFIITDDNGNVLRGSQLQNYVGTSSPSQYGVSVVTKFYYTAMIPDDLTFDSIRVRVDKMSTKIVNNQYLAQIYEIVHGYTIFNQSTDYGRRVTVASPRVGTEYTVVSTNVNFFLTMVDIRMMFMQFQSLILVVVR